eukprot:COSAG06_NODE_4619_length_4093_cov_55.188216_2_plen_85_part_00
MWDNTLIVMCSDNGGEKNAPFRAICMQKRSFCQDRLGTNVGKAEKKHVSAGPIYQNGTSGANNYPLRGIETKASFFRDAILNLN